MSPYFREEDVPEPACEGSYLELDREGVWHDPNRPKEIVCPVCGVKLTPYFEEYEIEEKKAFSSQACPCIIQARSRRRVILHVAHSTHRTGVLGSRFASHPPVRSER